MGYGQRLKIFLSAIASVSVLVAGVTIAFLSHGEMRRERQGLQLLARNQVQFLESWLMAPELAALDQDAKQKALVELWIRQAEQHRDDWYITLGQRRGQDILLFVGDRPDWTSQGQPLNPEHLQWQPLNRALAGESGVIFRRPPQGAPRLIAYEPIRQIQGGITVSQTSDRSGIWRLGFEVVTIILLIDGGLFLIAQSFLRRLETQELQHSYILNTLPDAIIRVSQGGIIQDINHGGEKIFGYGASQLIHQPIQTIIPKLENIQELEKLADFQHLIDNPHLRQVQVIGQKSDRTTFPLELQAFPVVAGPHTHFNLIARDITQDNEIKEALNREQEFVDTVITLAPSLVYVLDRQGQVIRFNETCETVTGYTFSEVVGKPLEPLLIPEAEKPLVRDKFNQIQGGQVPCSYEHHWLTKDGDRRRIAWSNSAILDDQGTVEYFIGTGLDITDIQHTQQQLQKLTKELEQKVLERTAKLGHSEAQLRAIFNNSGMGIVVATMGGEIIQSNQKFRELTGYDETTLHTINFPSLFLSPTAPDIPLLVQSLRETGHPYQVEQRIRCQNQTQRWCKLTASLLQLEDGRAEYFMVMVDDISRRKTAEISEQNLLQRNQSLVKALGDIVYEYRWPLDLVQWSGNYEKLLGYSVVEMGDDLNAWLEKIHPEDRDRTLAGFDQEFQDEHLFEREYRLRHRDGHYLWIYDSGVMHQREGELKSVIGILRDITAKKQADRILEKTKEKYQSIVGNTQEGFCMIDLQGKMLEVNQAYCEMTGYSREALLTMTIEHLEAKENFSQIQSHIEKIIAQGSDRFETCHQRRDGSHIYLEVSSNYIPSSQCIFSFMRDMTERIQIYEQIQLSQSRLLEAQKIAHIGSWEYDIQGDRVQGSQEFYQIYGYGPDHAGLNKESYLQRLHPDDRSQFQELFTNAVTHGKAYCLDYRIILPQGEIRYLEGHGKPRFNDQGQILKVFGTVLDITQRKQGEAALFQSEQKLRTLMDHTYDWEYWLDPDNQLLYMSPSCERITGYTAEQFYQKPELLTKIIHPQDLEEYLRHHHHSSTMDRVFMFDFRIITKTGSVRWIAHVCRTVYDHHYQCLGLRVSNRDISDRKATEEQLNQVNQQLQDWNQYLKNRNHEMQLLEEVRDFLQACLTLEEAYGALAALIQPLFGECAGAIFMVNPESQLLEIVSTWGDELHSETVFNPDQCWALRRGHSHGVDTETSNLLCHHVHLPAGAGPLELLCTPMMAQGKTMGLMYLAIEKNSDRPPYFSQERQKLAKTLTEQMALALANLALRETLKNQSIRDALTGLFNRRYLEECLTREIYRAQRQHYSVGVLMLDLDHFKQFNDRFGHKAGDLVLEKVGQFIKQNIRRSDIACRYGGEELTVLLPDAPLVNTLERAEDIRSGLKDLRIQYEGQLLGPITVSIGVACFPDHGHNSEILIKMADHALYRAKQQQRDCVVVALNIQDPNPFPSLGSDGLRAEELETPKP